MHLILDVQGDQSLSNTSVIANLLLDVVIRMDLSIRHFHLQKFPTVEKSGPGVSGMVLIAESHICIHTWPEKSLVQLCIHSCKDFNAKLVTELVIRAFAGKVLEQQLLVR